MKTGCLGDIEFYVSDDAIKTFRGLTYESSVNYAEHKRINGVPLLEMTSKSISKVSFTVLISESLGIESVEYELAELESRMNDGEALSLVIGNIVIGRWRWVITSLSVTPKVYDARGVILEAEVKISLSEYVG